MFSFSTRTKQKIYLASMIGLAITGSVILATGSLSTVSLLLGTALLFLSLMLMIHLSISQSVPPPPRYSRIV